MADVSTQFHTLVMHHTVGDMLILFDKHDTPMLLREQ